MDLDSRQDLLHGFCQIRYPVPSTDYSFPHSFPVEMTLQFHLAWAEIPTESAESELSACVSASAGTRHRRVLHRPDSEDIGRISKN